MVLQKKNGLDVSPAYANDKACATFIGVIADVMRGMYAVLNLIAISLSSLDLFSLALHSCREAICLQRRAGIAACEVFSASGVDGEVVLFELS